MEADIYGAQNGTWLGAGAFPAHSNNKHHQERLKYPFARGNVLCTEIHNHNLINTYSLQMFEHTSSSIMFIGLLSGHVGDDANDKCHGKNLCLEPSNKCGIMNSHARNACFLPSNISAVMNRCDDACCLESRHFNGSMIGLKILSPGQLAAWKTGFTAFKATETLFKYEVLLSPRTTKVKLLVKRSTPPPPSGGGAHGAPAIKPPA